MSDTREREPARDGPPDDAADAIERYGRVYTTSSYSDRRCVHIHPHCSQATDPDSRRGRTVTREAELPLRCNDVCERCKNLNTDTEGRLRPATDDGELVKRADLHSVARRVCGCLDCRRDGLVRIDHPEHGERVVCPVHQRRHPVKQVLGP